MEEVATASEAARAAVGQLSENYLRQYGTPQPDMRLDPSTDDHRDCSTSSNQALSASRMATWEPSSTRAYAKFRQLQIHKPQSPLQGRAAAHPSPAAGAAAAAAPCGAMGVATTAAEGAAASDQGLLSSRLAAEQARTTRLQTALQECRCLQSYYALERKHLLLQLQQLQGALQAAACGSGAAGVVLGGLGLGDLHPDAVAAAMAAAAESEVGLRVASKQLPPDAAVAALSTSPCDAVKRLATSFEQLHKRYSEQLAASGEAQAQVQAQLEQAQAALRQQEEAASQGLAQQRSKYHARLLQLRKACGEEASQLQAQVSQLQQLMQASSAQQQQLEQQLGQAAHREAVNQQLVQDLKRQLAAETAQHQAASQRLQQREGEHQATASQLSSLQQQHEQLSSALTTATEQLEEAAEQLTAAEARIQDLESAHQHSSASATEQAAAAAQARIQLRKAKDAAKQAAVGAAARNEQLSVLKSKAAQAAQQVAAARAAAKEAAQQLAEQQQLCAQQGAALEEARQELTTVRRAAAVAGRERQAEAARASAAEASAAAAQAAAAASEAACQLLQKQADALQQQVAAAEALSAQHKQSWQQQQELAGSLQRQVAAYKKEVLQKQRQLVEAARQLRAVKQQAAAAVQELDGVREDVEMWNLLKRQTYSRGASPGAARHTYPQQQQQAGMLSEQPWASPPSTSGSGVAATAADVLLVHDAPPHARASRRSAVQAGSSSRVRRSSQVSSFGVVSPGGVWGDAPGRGEVFKQALQLDTLLQDKEVQLQVALQQVQQLEGLVLQLEQQLEDAQQQLAAASVHASRPSSGGQDGSQDRQQLALQLAVAQAQLQQERCQAQLREQELLSRAQAAQQEANQLRARLQQLQQLLHCSGAAAAADVQTGVAQQALSSSGTPETGVGGGLGDADVLPCSIQETYQTSNNGSRYLARPLAAAQHLAASIDNGTQTTTEATLSADNQQHTVARRHREQDHSSRRSQAKPKMAQQDEGEPQQSGAGQREIGLRVGSRYRRGVLTQQQRQQQQGEGQGHATGEARSTVAPRKWKVQGCVAYHESAAAGAVSELGSDAAWSDHSCQGPTDDTQETSARPAAAAAAGHGQGAGSWREEPSRACFSPLTQGLVKLGAANPGSDQDSDVSGEHSTSSSNGCGHSSGSSEGEAEGVTSQAAPAAAAQRTREDGTAPSGQRQQQDGAVRGKPRAPPGGADSKPRAASLPHRLTGTARLLKAQQQAQLVAAAAAAPLPAAAPAGGGLSPASGSAPGHVVHGAQAAVGISQPNSQQQQQQQLWPCIAPGAVAGGAHPVQPHSPYEQQQWLASHGAAGWLVAGGLTPPTSQALLPLATPTPVPPNSTPVVSYMLTQGASSTPLTAAAAATAAAAVAGQPLYSSMPGAQVMPGWGIPAAVSSSTFRPGDAGTTGPLQPLANVSCGAAGSSTHQLGPVPHSLPPSAPLQQQVDVVGGVGSAALAAEVEEALQAAQAALAASSQC